MCCLTEEITEDLISKDFSVTMSMAESEGLLNSTSLFKFVMASLKYCGNNMPQYFKQLKQKTVSELKNTVEHLKYKRTIQDHHGI